jgi:hypothetical protein
MFEYRAEQIGGEKMFSQGASAQKLQERLNALAAEGWQLKAAIANVMTERQVTGVLAIFERSAAGL